MDIKLNKLINMIPGEILILSRNNMDISFDDERISFKTVHKSKGLESNNVILLNLNNGRYGFPNKIENKLQRKILPKNKYLYEEERRLFYVALTRTKNNIYLLVDKQNPSIFVKELIYNSKRYIEVINL